MVSGGFAGIIMKRGRWDTLDGKRKAGERRAGRRPAVSTAEETQKYSKESLKLYIGAHENT